jgi:hypothetical protein
MGSIGGCPASVKPAGRQVEFHRCLVPAGTKGGGRRSGDSR